MSGSPVCTKDGRLIGSVSYGLSYAPSMIAGITPAASMKPLLAQAAAASPSRAGSLLRRKVGVDRATAARLAATGKATALQAAGGFNQLTVPLWVSGAGSRVARPMLDRLQQSAPFARVLSGGASAPAAPAPASSVSAGGNFAAGLSYGAVTLAAIGTTTFVCGTQAVAFGHPFLFVGSTRFSAHPATAVFVQPDPVYGSFKVANPGGVAGTVDLDNLTGIRAKLGVAPPTTLVTAGLTPVGGTAARLTSRAVYEPWTPDVAAFNTLYGVEQALGSDTPGSAAVTITVKGTRANGRAFTLTRSDRYASTYAISYAVADQVYYLISDLVNQTLEDVHLTSIAVTGTVEPTIRQYSVTALKVKKGAAYVTPTDPISAIAGGNISLRYTLTPYKGIGSQKTVDLSVPVAAGTAGSSATLQALGGSDIFAIGPAPSDFTELLDNWRKAPRNASVHASLDIGGKVTTVTVPVDAAVQYYNSQFGVDIG
jgi:hypothetical protein